MSLIFGGVRNFGVVALFRGVFHGFLLSASDLTVCVMTVWQPSSGGSSMMVLFSVAKWHSPSKVL